MRSKIMFAVVLALAAIAYAKDSKHYQTGKVLQMDSVPCGTAEKDASKKTQEVLCQEYLVQSDRVIFRIRSRDEKHPVLLPIGGQAEFRLEKDKMMLRVEDLDQKERQYIVVSMAPRSDASSADAAPARVNHLQ